MCRVRLGVLEGGLANHQSPRLVSLARRRGWVRALVTLGVLGWSILVAAEALIVRSLLIVLSWWSLVTVKSRAASCLDLLDSLHPL